MEETHMHPKKLIRTPSDEILVPLPTADPNTKSPSQDSLVPFGVYNCIMKNNIQNTEEQLLNMDEFNLDENDSFIVNLSDNAEVDFSHIEPTFPPVPSTSQNYLLAGNLELEKEPDYISTIGHPLPNLETNDEILQVPGFDLDNPVLSLDSYTVTTSMLRALSSEQLKAVFNTTPEGNQVETSEGQLPVTIAPTITSPSGTPPGPTFVSNPPASYESFVYYLLQMNNSNVMNSTPIYFENTLNIAEGIFDGENVKPSTVNNINNETVTGATFPNLAKQLESQAVMEQPPVNNYSSTGARRKQFQKKKLCKKAETSKPNTASSSQSAVQTDKRNIKTNLPLNQEPRLKYSFIGKSRKAPKKTIEKVNVNTNESDGILLLNSVFGASLMYDSKQNANSKFIAPKDPYDFTEEAEILEVTAMTHARKYIKSSKGKRSFETDFPGLEMPPLPKSADARDVDANKKKKKKKPSKSY